MWVLWFNAVKDWRSYHVPAYYVMVCNDNGDFSVLTSGASAAVVCSLGGLSEEQLSRWWADGTGVGTRNLTGLARPMTATASLPFGEGAGGFLRSDGTWELTYSLPGCGYCTGPPALKSAARRRQRSRWSPWPPAPGPAPRHAKVTRAPC